MIKQSNQSILEFHTPTDPIKNWYELKNQEKEN